MVNVVERASGVRFASNGCVAVQGRAGTGAGLSTASHSHEPGTWAPPCVKEPDGGDVGGILYTAVRGLIIPPWLCPVGRGRRGAPAPHPRLCTRVQLWSYG